MALSLLRKFETEDEPQHLSPDTSVRPEIPSTLPPDAIDQAVIDLRRMWGLSLPEACALQQAALGYSDRIAAFRLARSRSALRRNWQSIGQKSGHDHHRRAVFDVWQRASLIRDTVDFTHVPGIIW